MNEMSIESFITYCDDMTIAEEGFKEVGKKVLISLKNFIRKVIQFFKNFMLNINMFKTAELPKMQIHDILKISQNATPHYQYYIKSIDRTITTYIKRDIKEDEKDYEKKIFLSWDAGRQIREDAEQNISDIENSVEYKRLQKNEYRGDITEIPLANVISTVKIANSWALKCDMLIEKYDSFAKNNPVINDAANLAMSSFTAVSKLFRIQINVLSILIKAAKSSVHAIKDNIKDKITGTVAASSKFGESDIKQISRFLTSRKTIKFTSEEKKEKFKVLDRSIRECDGLRDFPKYKKAYSELCKFMGANAQRMLLYPMENDDKKVTCYNLKEEGKEITLLDNMVLYHSSPVDNLTELHGTYRSIGGGFVRCMTEPRIYCSIGKPMSRDGSIYDGIDRSRDGARSHLYKIEGNFKVFRDIEMGGTSAVYIKANKVKCTKID